MRGFEFVRPTTFEQALTLLNDDDPTIRPVSGGTALMLMMKMGIFQPSKLISLADVEDKYRAITKTDDGGLHIGGLATLTTIEKSREVAEIAPTITSTMTHLANVRVRNVACVGGCLAHGDPHMDLPPVLAALGAAAQLQGVKQTRSVPIANLYSGYYETILEQGELIATVSVPPQTDWRSTYLKCTTRSADDWPALGVAINLKLDGDTISDARVFISAATEKLTCATDAQEQLVGQKFGQTGLFTKAAESAAAEIETIDDAQGSAQYKSELIRVYVRRALEQICGEGGAQ